MVVASGVPPVETVYQSIPLPVAERFATVGLLIAQKFWGDVPEGAVGLLTTTDKARRLVDSQLPYVWLA